MEWNKKACLALISHYRSQPVLWNNKHNSYYSKSRKQKAWRIVAENMQISVDEARQKMNSLMGSFRRERSKMRRGEGRYAYDHASRWFAFNKMRFLLDRNEELSNEDIDIDQNQIKLEDFALDSDSSHLLEEELNEATEASPNGNDLTEQIPIRPARSQAFQKVKINRYNIPIVEDFSVSSSHDECTAYGNYVASKLRKLSSRTRSTVEHAINNVLFEADLGKYDDLASPIDNNKQPTQINNFLSPHLDEINLFPGIEGSPAAEAEGDNMS